MKVLKSLQLLKFENLLTSVIYSCTDFSKLDEDRTDLVKQHGRFSALNLVISSDEGGRTAR